MRGTIASLLGIVLIATACGGSGPAPPAAAPGAARPAPASATQADGAAATAPASVAPPAAPASAPVQIGPTTPTRVKASYSVVSAGVGPVWAALEAGLWQKYGLDVDVTLISGTPNSVAALLSGEVQFIQNSADAALSVQAAEPNVVAVANTSASSAHRMIVGPGIERFEDLRGKRIGVFTHGDGNYALISKALIKYGYAPDRDVIWTPVGGGNFAGLVAALASGAIDATLLTPPNDLVAVKNGGRVLFSYADLGLPFAGLPVYTLRPTIERQRPVVEGYLAGLIEGARLFKSDAAFAKDLLQRWTNLADPEMLDWTYDAYRGDRVSDRPFLDLDQTRAVMESLAGEQPDLRNINFERAFDNSILRDLERKGFFDQR